MYYFTNYIFLKPTGNFSILPHGGQVYEYTQSKAMLTGVEVDAHYQLKQLSLQAQFAYLYNQQISANGVNYPLPFSTPINGQFKVGYFFGDTNKIQQNEVQLSTKVALKQNRIAQNEEITPGYAIVNAQWSSVLNFKGFKPQVRLQVNNLFNKVYYHHNSFYRALDIPEFGRSVQVFLTIPIN